MIRFQEQKWGLTIEIMKSFNFRAKTFVGI